MLASEVIVRGSGNFIGFPDICWKALLDAGFVVMLFLVLHLLGYLLKIGSRSDTSRPLCFTTGFPGAPNGPTPQHSSICSNSVHRLGATGPKTVKGEVMAQYLVAIYLSDDFDPSSADKSMEHDIDVLNEEMEAKGVRLFAGGLRPASDAKSLRAQPDGKVLVTDGPYLETKEHVGGFWILEVADMDEALAWARKAVVACRA